MKMLWAVGMMLGGCVLTALWTRRPHNTRVSQEAPATQERLTGGQSQDDEPDNWAEWEMEATIALLRENLSEVTFQLEVCKEYYSIIEAENRQLHLRAKNFCERKVNRRLD